MNWDYSASIVTKFRFFMWRSGDVAKPHNFLKLLRHPFHILTYFGVDYIKQIIGKHELHK